MTMRASLDWGEPQPADWRGPREPLSARLPPDLVRQVRVRARSQGVSVSLMVQRLLEAGLRAPAASSDSPHGDLVSILFD